MVETALLAFLALLVLLLGLNSAETIPVLTLLLALLLLTLLTLLFLALLPPLVLWLALWLRPLILTALLLAPPVLTRHLLLSWILLSPLILCSHLLVGEPWLTILLLSGIPRPPFGPLLCWILKSQVVIVLVRVDVLSVHILVAPSSVSRIDTWTTLSGSLPLFRVMESRALIHPSVLCGTMVFAPETFTLCSILGLFRPVRAFIESHVLIVKTILLGPVSRPLVAGHSALLSA